MHKDEVLVRFQPPQLIWPASSIGLECHASNVEVGGSSPSQATRWDIGVTVKHATLIRPQTRFDSLMSYLDSSLSDPMPIHRDEMGD